MADFIAIIRDESGQGVRADRVDGWGRYPAHPGTGVRVYLAGGGVVDLLIPRPAFVERLDRALTAMAEEV